MRDDISIKREIMELSGERESGTLDQARTMHAEAECALLRIKAIKEHKLAAIKKVLMQEGMSGVKAESEAKSHEEVIKVTKEALRIQMDEIKRKAKLRNLQNRMEVLQTLLSLEQSKMRML